MYHGVHYDWSLLYVLVTAMCLWLPKWSWVRNRFKVQSIMFWVPVLVSRKLIQCHKHVDIITVYVGGDYCRSKELLCVVMKCLPFPAILCKTEVLCGLNMYISNSLIHTRQSLFLLARPLCFSIYSSIIY